MENNNTKKTIGNRINTLLANQRKTQKSLADELGVKPNVISYFCKGDRTPNTEQLVKIAHFFNVSTDYLLGLTNARTKDATVSFMCNWLTLNDASFCALMRFSLSRNNSGEGRNNEIKNWFITNYLSPIVYALEHLEKYSDNVVKLGSVDKILHQTGKSDKDILEEVYDRKDSDLKCDVERYKLVKIVEKMANAFDRREQVKNNGDDNSTNK